MRARLAAAWTERTAVAAVLAYVTVAENESTPGALLGAFAALTAIFRGSLRR